MNQVIVQSSGGITLVGGGPVAASLFRDAHKRAGLIVAADSGADRCLAFGMEPQAVIGDMDSVSGHAREILGAARFHVIAEQVTTDFDKALRSLDAPFVLAVGFMGARSDHGLAVFNALARSQQRCILLGARDVIFHMPRQTRLHLRRGDRISLFPMAPVTGQSSGLAWPLQGLEFAPDGRIGTSNRVAEPEVQVDLSGPGMLCILPRARLDAAIAALTR